MNKAMSKLDSTRNHSKDLNNPSDIVQSLDVNGNILAVSPKWLVETGYEEDEVIGRFFGEFLDEKCIGSVGRNFPHLKDYGFVDNVPLTLRRKDGVLVNVALNGTSKYDENGNFERTYCELRTLDYYMNSTNAIQKLLEQERLYNSILNIKSNITSLVLDDITFEELIESVIDILNQPVEIEKCDIIYVLDNEKDDEYAKALRNLADGFELSEEKNSVLLMKDKVPNSFPLGQDTDSLLIAKVHNSISNIDDFYIGIELNISGEFAKKWEQELSAIASNLELVVNNIFLNQEKSRLIQELENLSMTDKLTQLYNRVKIDEELNTQMKTYKRYGNDCSIILIDIDNFKKINDKHGHLLGDETLKLLAKILVENTRDVDLVGRWGGEEFLIICPNTTIENAKIIAEKLRKSVEMKNFKHNEKVTISLGISCFVDDLDIEKIVDNADKALYESKINGKNQLTVSK